MPAGGDLEQLAKKVIAFRDARDWRQFHTAKDVAISLSLEAGELLEHFQWKDEAKARAWIETHREDVADEVADVLYWLLLFSHDAGIDLAQALERKLAKNEAKYPVEKSRGSAKKYTEFH